MYSDKIYHKYIYTKPGPPKGLVKNGHYRQVSFKLNTNKTTNKNVFD